MIVPETETDHLTIYSKSGPFVVPQADPQFELSGYPLPPLSEKFQ
jgi:hypothetical protein